MNNIEWSVISAVNNERVLETSLLASEGIRSATQLILQRGFTTAASAYNDGIRRATSDLLVFVHQDVYLPEGWIQSVEKSIQTLWVHDPNWGVLGVWGAIDSRQRTGYLYWTGGHGRERPFTGAKEVMTLDELVLIFRKSSGLRFDEQLPGYHLYGADICMEARRRGRKCHVIPAFCIHNTNVGGLLPLEFWKCYLFIRRKWKDYLPIDTPCTRITFGCWPMIRWNLMYARNVTLGRQKRFTRVANPDELYREFVARGLVRPNKVLNRRSVHVAVQGDRNPTAPVKEGQPPDSQGAE